jgi:diguanylate cyclase (GGDEF)-like protein
VPDGTKALQALEQYPHIKMVITDQEMPGMDGIELVQRIRKKYAKNELIVIGLSGANRSYQSARFIKNGADDFLRKPFCPEEFYCRIMQNIEKLDYLTKIETAAKTDYVTELYNRRYFLEQVKKIHKNLAGDKKIYMLVTIQVNNFKGINDQYGNEMGDQVLIALASLLNNHFDGQLSARFGGAIFGLLACGISPEDIDEALAVLKEQAGKQQVSFNGKNASFSITLAGVMLTATDSVETLLKQSAEALQRAL